MKESTKVFGLAWFKKEDWPRLLEISEGRDSLEETHAEWLKEAEKVIKNFKKQGLKIKKVPVTPNKLLIWCNDQGIPINGEARSRFAAYKLHEKGKTA